MFREKGKRKRGGLKGADDAGMVMVEAAARKVPSAAGSAPAEVAVARSGTPSAAGTGTAAEVVARSSAPAAVAVAPLRSEGRRRQ